MGGGTEFFKNLSAGINAGMQMQFLMSKEGNNANLADARRANDMQALAGMDPMKAEQYLNLMGDDYIKKSGIPDSFVQRTRQSASALRDWTDSSQQMMAAALQSGNPAAIQRAHQAALSSYLAIPGAVRDAKSIENIMTEMGKNARDIYQADKIKQERQAAQELTGATKDLRGINNSELPRSLKNKAAANYFGRLNQRVNQNLPNNEKVTFNPRTVEMLGKLDQDQIDSVINFIEGNANQSPLETIHHAVKFLTAPDNEALDMLHKEILPRSTAQDDGKFLKPVDGPEEPHPADGLSQDVENARDRMDRLRTATSYDPSLKDKFLEAESQHLKLVKR
ncbi:MAG: hypothetical protein KGH87_06580, partial [Thaumarchaeota archaeon]|nr:hypothetical protein [Nitrososphaerota archaeon]